MGSDPYVGWFQVLADGTQIPFDSEILTKPVDPLDSALASLREANKARRKQNSELKKLMRDNKALALQVSSLEARMDVMRKQLVGYEALRRAARRVQALILGISNLDDHSALKLATLNLSAKLLRKTPKSLDSDDV